MQQRKQGKSRRYAEPAPPDGALFAAGGSGEDAPMVSKQARRPAHESEKKKGENLFFLLEVLE